jgi:hypothetical protein
MEPPRVAKAPVRIEQPLEKPALSEKPPTLEEQSERPITSKTPLEVKQQAPPLQKVEKVVVVRSPAHKAEVIPIASVPEVEEQPEPPEPRVEPPVGPALPEKPPTLEKKPEKLIQQNVEPKPHPARQSPAMQNPKEVVAAESIEDSPASVAPEPERAVFHSLERIEKFLASYCGAYQDLNYDLFMGYFTADAIENDQAVKDLEPRYRRNFLNLRDLAYHIDVDHYVVRDDMIEVSGDYILRWRFKKTGWKEREGPIFLSLVQVDEDYRVRRLVYQ